MKVYTPVDAIVKVPLPASTTEAPAAYVPSKPAILKLATDSVLSTSLSFVRTLPVLTKSSALAKVSALSTEASSTGVIAILVV